MPSLHRPLNMTPSMVDRFEALERQLCHHSSIVYYIVNYFGFVPSRWVAPVHMNKCPRLSLHPLLNMPALTANHLESLERKQLLHHPSVVYCVGDSLARGRDVPVNQYPRPSLHCPLNMPPSMADHFETLEWQMGHYSTVVYFIVD